MTGLAPLVVIFLVMPGIAATSLLPSPEAWSQTASAAPVTAAQVTHEAGEAHNKTVGYVGVTVDPAAKTSYSISTLAGVARVFVPRGTPVTIKATINTGQIQVVHLDPLSVTGTATESRSDQTPIITKAILGGLATYVESGNDAKNRPVTPHIESFNSSPLFHPSEPASTGTYRFSPKAPGKPIEVNVRVGVGAIDIRELSPQWSGTMSQSKDGRPYVFQDYWTKDYGLNYEEPPMPGTTSWGPAWQFSGCPSIAPTTAPATPGTPTTGPARKNPFYVKDDEEDPTALEECPGYTGQGGDTK